MSFIRCHWRWSYLLCHNASLSSFCVSDESGHVVLVAFEKKNILWWIINNNFSLSFVVDTTVSWVPIFFIITYLLETWYLISRPISKPLFFAYILIIYNFDVEIKLEILDLTFCFVSFIIFFFLLIFRFFLHHISS